MLEAYTEQDGVLVPHPDLPHQSRTTDQCFDPYVEYDKKLADLFDEFYNPDLGVPYDMDQSRIPQNFLGQKSAHLPCVLGEFATLPTRGKDDDAGLDLYAAEDCLLAVGQTKIVKTQLRAALPRGTVGLILDRSSMGVKAIGHLGGVIDNNYRDEWGIILINLSDSPYQISKGHKVAQVVCVDYVKLHPYVVATLDETERKGGYGTTGL